MKEAGENHLKKWKSIKKLETNNVKLNEESTGSRRYEKGNPFVCYIRKRQRN